MKEVWTLTAKNTYQEPKFEFDDCEEMVEFLTTFLNHSLNNEAFLVSREKKEGKK